MKCCGRYHSNHQIKPNRRQRKDANGNWIYSKRQIKEAPVGSDSRGFIHKNRTWQVMGGVAARSSYFSQFGKGGDAGWFSAIGRGRVSMLYRREDRARELKKKKGRVVKKIVKPEPLNASQ